MIKAVIFDVDGVLLDSFEANFKFFQDLMSFTGYNPPTREVYKTTFHLPMDQAIAKLIPTADEKEVQRIWLLGKSHAVPYQEKSITIPDNCESTLKILSKKYALAIVTSRVKSRVSLVPQLTALQNFFQIAVFFEDTEKHKPEPEPLLLACERLAIKPNEAVYVGDAQSDMNAAKAAGMKAIAYTKDELLGADARTNLFIEIPKLVQKIG
ncbi:MAG: Pyrophosphatase PpaX [Candidatus Pacebacteria bacterium GW2011_GWF2_38_9]|nr:MAG: pyrophosphatase PpaX, pyrophosphatase PpaX [candidate division TM6 bacterium GW2011_GWF2_28_16]KKQ07400.1 MAG: Pyrophosphatase PpaX [Candidatus Pacebacteria bacterium GW2011_GWF1_36_5]KKQ88614.1 MAG: Pyrophosphatase PpaX [Candidatus Pacebacteria bacterium GW2011_GWF2_38_9]HAZ73478.1 hypothetical protein [Candidatus Paceibacterota bacterium]